MFLDQTNVALISIRRFIKNFQILTDPKPLNSSKFYSQNLEEKNIHISNTLRVDIQILYLFENHISDHLIRGNIDSYRDF